jgi:hypothetical protein
MFFHNCQQVVQVLCMGYRPEAIWSKPGCQAACVKQLVSSNMLLCPWLSDKLKCAEILDRWHSQQCRVDLSWLCPVKKGGKSASGFLLLINVPFFTMHADKPKRICRRKNYTCLWQANTNTAACITYVIKFNKLQALDQIKMYMLAKKNQISCTCACGNDDNTCIILSKLKTTYNTACITQAISLNKWALIPVPIESEGE